MLDEVEAAFGTDLSAMSVDLGSSDPEDVGAAATSTAEGLAFRDANPDTELVAEEVAHAIQRDNGQTGTKHLSDGSDAAEKEARNAAKAVARGEQAPEIVQRASAAVHRHDEEPAASPADDAARLSAAMRSRTEADVTRVLGQRPAHVQAVRAEYDANHNTRTGRGLVEDLREAYVVADEWERVVVLLQRAGIAVPNTQVAVGDDSYAIVPDRTIARAVPNTEMTYRVGATRDMVDDPRSTMEYAWFCVNDANAVARQGAPAEVTGPTDGSWDATWRYTGVHTLLVKVQPVPYGRDRPEPFWLEYEQEVVTSDELMGDGAAGVQEQDWVALRASMEVQRQQLAGGGLADQSAGAGPHITNSGPNPTTMGRAPNLATHTYRAAGLQAPARNWYAVPEDTSHVAEGSTFGGAQATTWRGRFAYDLGTGDEARFVIGFPNTYEIVCEGQSADGQPTGEVATYRQVIQTSDEAEQLRRHQEETGLIDEAMSSMSSEGRQSARAVYVNEESGTRVQLNFYIGPADEGDGYVLVDATPGVRVKEFSGSTEMAALADFERLNVYPRGQIDLIMPIPSTGQQTRRNIQTDGSSSWSDWAAATGWASLGLFVAGAVATVVPGGQVAAPFLFAAGAAAGAASGAMGIYEELQQAEPSAARIGINVAAIASSILGGGAAIQSVRQGAGVTLATTTGRFFVYGALTADIGSAVLLSAEGIADITRIVEDGSMSEQDKITAIVGILTTLAVSGGLIALGARELRVARGRVGASIADDVLDQLEDRAVFALSDLDDAALARLGRANVEQLGEIATAMTTLGKNRVNGLLGALDLDQAMALVRVGRSVPTEFGQVLDAIATLGNARHAQVLGELAANARVAGVDEFIRDASTKIQTGQGGAPTPQQLTDLDNMLNELYVARHEAGNLGPGEQIQLGGDVQSAGRSFDVRTANGAGQVQRAIEVKTIEAPVSSAANMDSGVSHAAEKVSGLPQGAVAEAAIHVEFAPQTPLGRNLRLMEPNGAWRMVDPADHTIEHATGNMIDDFMRTRLARGNPRPGESVVDRVTFFDKNDGSHIGTLVKNNGTWSRTQ